MKMEKVVMKLVTGIINDAFQHFLHDKTYPLQKKQKKKKKKLNKKQPTPLSFQVTFRLG